jgi:peptidoglycan/LPS O-acetylase OafA/YrhL
VRVHSRLGYVPTLDGLRGIAIASVVLYHAGLLPGGFLGVDLFFVLSGFLITTLLLEERAANGRVNLRAFYVRRARRLLPGLLALLLLLALWALVARPVDAPLLEDIGLTLAYVANIYRAYFHHFAEPLSMMWSLAQEEQFYLFWPALLLALLRFTKRRSIVVGCALGLVALWAWRVGLVLDGASVRRIRFSPDTHFDPLLIGCLLAFCWRRLPRLGAVALVGFLAEEFVARDVSRLVLAAGAPVAAVAAALVVGDAARGRMRVLEWRPLVWLGKISYSVYVWQALAFLAVEQLDLSVAGTRFIAITFAVALGAASYRFVEQPFRRRRSQAVPLPLPS